MHRSLYISALLALAAAGCGTTDSWKLLGNLNTDPVSDFLGTRDGQPLELRVNNNRALLIEPTVSTPNLIGGYIANSAADLVIGGVIAGGGQPGFQNTIFDNFDCIGGGENNVAGSDDGSPGTAQFATIAGGDGNVASAEQATVGGGSQNVAAGVASTVSGGQGHRCTGDYSAIAGGIDNDCPGAQSFIGGGIRHRVSGAQSTIAGGGGNSISSNLSGIVAGSFQGISLSADRGFIGAGSSNQNWASAGGAICGGSWNETINSAAFIGGGEGNWAVYGNNAIVAGFENTTHSPHSFVGAGQNNRIDSGHDSAAIVAGNDNDVFASQSFMGAGEGNDSSGAAPAILGGSGNECSEFSFIGAGSNNAADGNSVIVGGADNTGTAIRTFIGGGVSNQVSALRAVVSGGSQNIAAGIDSVIPGGNGARTDRRGQFALASGAFGTPGDAQTAIYVLRNTSLDATPVELFLDGAGERLNIVPGRSCTFDCMVIGRASNGLSLGFHFSGVIVNIGGTTSIVGTRQLVNSDVDGGLAGATAEVDADDTNDALRVTCTGLNGFSIRWVASIRIDEVSF